MSKKQFSMINVNNTKENFEDNPFNSRRTFIDKDKVKNQMKKMISLSENKRETISTFKVNVPKQKITNTIELHNEKISELNKLNKVAETLFENQNTILKAISEENTDTFKLIEYYKKQIEIEKKIYDDLEAEEKKIKYKEEIFMEESKKELEANIKIIQSIKEECYQQEAELTNKEYRLASLKQRTEEMSHKIEFNTIELDDKIKLKLYKQNELNNREKELEETKLRIGDLQRINSEYIDYLRMIHNDLQESKGNIRVFCRVRPMIAKELKEEPNNLNYIEFPNYNTIVLNGPVMKSNTGKSKDTQYREIYKFDRVFRPEDTQEDVFQEISQLVQSALDGYKVCIFAYGQTGSGKTYTMEGEDEHKRGIISRSIEQIFQFKSTLENMGWSFIVEASCVEIYMDQVRDLLMNSTNNIISQNNKVEKFTSNVVKEVEDLHSILQLTGQKRAVAETQCNEKSSRSHCIFQLKITGKNNQTKQERHGALNLIDLAGSERISSSKVEGERMKETISINKSLTCLKSVITALVNTNTKSNTHIPYRDSILTYLLQNYLGGDSKTLMFVNISPLMSNFPESSCSLKFASDVNSCYLRSSEDK